MQNKISRNGWLRNQERVAARPETKAPDGCFAYTTSAGSILSWKERQMEELKAIKLEKTGVEITKSAESKLEG